MSDGQTRLAFNYIYIEPLFCEDPGICAQRNGSDVPPLIFILLRINRMPQGMFNAALAACWSVCLFGAEKSFFSC